jgi:hypothetical protein
MRSTAAELVAAALANLERMLTYDSGAYADVC